MKTISIIKNLGYPVLISGLGGLLSLGISVSAWGAGACVQDDPGASTVITSGGTQSCDRVGQFGCPVRFGKRGVGGCIVYDDNENKLFTVVSRFNSEDGLSWTIEDSTTNTPLAAKVNTVIVKSQGVEDGNACNYIYADEAVAGSGQGWLIPSEIESEVGTFGNVGVAYFCTDGVADDIPPPRCEDNPDLGGVIVECDTSSSDPLIVITATPENPTWNPLACSCNIPEGLETCDENAGEFDENKCMGDGNNKALPVGFELINDGTTICRVINGERTCWKVKRR